MPLKHGQGHWKWYEQVKFNEYYHNAQIDISHISGVQENPNISFWQALTVWPKTWKLSPLNTHQSHKSYCPWFFYFFPFFF